MYADSLNVSAKPPKDKLQLFLWWLESLNPKNVGFQLISADFAMPCQCDSSSCGVVLSTMAQIRLDYEPWSVETHHCEHIEWVSRIYNAVGAYPDTQEVDVSIFHSLRLSTTRLEFCSERGYALLTGRSDQHPRG